MVKTVWRLLLVFWLVSVLFVISLPGGKFDGTPHWEKHRVDSLFGTQLSPRGGHRNTREFPGLHSDWLFGG